MNSESNQQSSNPKSSTEHSALPPSYQQTARQRQRWVWLLPLILVTLGIGLLAGRYWGEKKAAQTLMEAQSAQSQSVTPQIATATGVTEVAVEHKPVLTVEVISPKQSVIENALSADGTIEPKNVATVNGKVSGVTLEQVLAEEGDVVKKGQVLAVFDTESMQQQQIQAQADLAEAQTQLELAESDASRVLPLLEINAVSGQEADRYVAKAKQAAASVAAAQARLNSQNLNLSNAQVVAPVSGIISEKTANVGSVPGQAPLFTIIENGVLEWQAQVDPNQLGKINVGTPVQVSLPKNKSVMGQVTRIAPVAEQGSRQVSIYATLQNSPLARAGMYQRGTFLLGSEGGQTLPMSAIVSEDGYNYVMLVEQEKDAQGNEFYRIKRKKVSLGERQDDRVVIEDPLPASAAIVRQGGGFLNDGDVVRVAGVSASNTSSKSSTSPAE
ncbi:efflux RND transporter periplasmic adaptor subunit [Psychrobacter sp. I-STPA6b]|uniref:efflux RND transporter periplasmic adaptor subunit n=1 Tax=Psychrobacter sp. I-STPA6b TaxID=2585718 RepID=UPI001D0C4E12|nr:efflux RND transporter periplasmic adaptor subunit [Psychrobacter sp. I-STPA6b]